MSNCGDEDHVCNHSSAGTQSFDEMEFERGIWFAAQYNNTSRIKQLLSKSNCVNLKDNFGYTALHYASRNGHLESCRLLLENGADINAITKEGKASSLHRAASQGEKEVVELLVDKGADLNLQDSDGKTAFFRAAENKHLKICEYFYKKAPHLLNIPNNKGIKIEDLINISTFIN